MEIFNGVISVTGVTFFMFCVLAIAAVGYALGRITIKGIELGTAGVFIAAIVFGCIFYPDLTEQMGDSTKDALKIIENLGLLLFVTSVGFIAGPNFFSNMKKNFKSYVLLGIIIIVVGGIMSVACIYIGRATGETDHDKFTAMVTGLMSGSLTSTPAFSAAKATVGAAYEDIVAVGYGIAYIFGVIGVVLFVQLIPKITHADMDLERKKISQVNTGSTREYKGKLITMDPFGLMPFMLAAAIGIIIGMIKIPLTGKGLDGTTFSLTTTGGGLFTALVFGHFGHAGKVNLMPPSSSLKVFREVGLMFFLIGAGIAGGANFVQNVRPVYFLYGVLITIAPMIVGYFVATRILKLSLFNTLGSITGGMTSTPALGTLINVTGTEDVASAYAATYPIALISVVLVSQFIIILF